MMQLLEFMMFFAIVLILVEHDRPRSRLHLLDDDDDRATEAAARGETSPPGKDENVTRPARS